MRRAAAFLALAMVAHQPLAAQANATSVALPPGGLLAQQAAYTFLGNSRGYDRIPGGILIRADHGAVLIEAIAGIGARIRAMSCINSTSELHHMHQLAQRIPK